MCDVPVSYTHLDVYKRQVLECVRNVLKVMAYSNTVIQRTGQVQE